MANHESVILIYERFRHAMASAGRKIKLPQNTDPKKTYQYRAVSRFADRVEQWGLSNDLTTMMIRAVVKYGKENGLLSKGTELLNMGSVLQICHNSLKNDLRKNHAVFKEIELSKSFFDKHVKELDAVSTLVSKVSRGGHPNIIYWYQAGGLSSSFLSVSGRCCKAISMLTAEDRMEIPSDTELLKTRLKLMSDADLKNKIISILGHDTMTSVTPAEKV